MKIDYEAALNPEQYEAVTSVEGPLLIVAGAGSGKTTVITYRMAYMIEQGIAQHSILALTFTNKAAREMADRVRSVTGRKLRDLTVSTFHAFGVKILRKEIAALGYKDNFSIYDEADKNQLIKDCAREQGFRMESFDAYKVGSLFSPDPQRAEALSKADDAYRGLYDEYRRSLRIFNAVDFDDLIVLPIELFELEPSIAARYRDTYRYMMIDEFQDTSLMQYRFMKLMASRNVCIVGRRRPVHLLLARGQLRELPALRAGLPGLQGGQARAQLPLHGDHPRRGQRHHSQQLEPQGEGALVRPRGRTARPSSCTRPRTRARRPSSSRG